MAKFQNESLTETLSIEDGLQLLSEIECGQGGGKTFWRLLQCG